MNKVLTEALLAGYEIYIEPRMFEIVQIQNIFKLTMRDKKNNKHICGAVSEESLKSAHNDDLILRTLETMLKQLEKEDFPLQPA